MRRLEVRARRCQWALSAGAVACGRNGGPSPWRTGADTLAVGAGEPGRARGAFGGGGRHDDRGHCSLFHAEAAKLFGATDEEIQEAVHYAKASLGWSAYINGMQEDYDQFASELGQVVEYVRSKG
ncbi:hypothetical protein ACIGBH_12055 [Streptomyces sp. NPDC085929]|uniref:hypothetical protein n=1 Tax=Streptomyces sp. NPDC085929 TaxID=3365739 RepID=UPI0037D8CDE4